METQLGFVESDPLLDWESSAEFLGVSPRMVKRIVAERRVPVVRVGRHIRIRQSALVAFIEANTTPARGVR